MSNASNTPGIFKRIGETFAQEHLHQVLEHLAAQAAHVTGRGVVAGFRLEVLGPDLLGVGPGSAVHECLFTIPAQTLREQFEGEQGIYLKPTGTVMVANNSPASTIRLGTAFSGPEGLESVSEAGREAVVTMARGEVLARAVNVTGPIKRGVERREVSDTVRLTLDSPTVHALVPVGVDVIVALPAEASLEHHFIVLNGAMPGGPSLIVTHEDGTLSGIIPPGGRVRIEAEWPAECEEPVWPSMLEPTVSQAGPERVPEPISKPTKQPPAKKV